MKKRPSTLIVIILLLSVLLTACSDGNGNNTLTSSGESEESVALPSGEESQEESSLTSAEEPSEEAEVFTYRTPVTIGCGYKTSKPAGDSYADSYNIELTDSLKCEREGASYSDPRLSGYGIGAYNILEVTVDLGKVTDRLYEFEVDYLDIDQSGISAPYAFGVAVSNDGETFTSLGNVKIKGASDASCKTCVIGLEKSVSARYVRFNITTGNFWVFIDEVTAYADIAGEDSEDFVLSVSEAYKNSSVSDSVLTESVEKVRTGVPDRTLGRLDVVSGRGYTVSKKSEGLFVDDGKKLTDGKKGTGTENDTWAAYKSENGLEITLDIGSVRTDVSAFSLHAATLGVLDIGYPAYVSFEVSSDKKEWNNVGTVYAPTTGSETVFDFALELPFTVKARYIRFVLPTSELYGTYLIDETGVFAYCVKSSDPPEEAGKWVAPSSDILGGVHDVFLAYHSKSDDFSVETLMNIIGYTDRNGKTADTLFDGVLFLMSGGFPSNGDGKTGGSNRYNKSDADWLIKGLFADDKNIGALETAVGKLKAELGLDDGYKVKYFLSIYTPNSEDFGDIDGDGISENSSNNTGMKKIAGYLIDGFYGELSVHQYDNIEFGGFYWYNEGITQGLKPVVSYVTDKIHERGDQVFWIPYYQAAGWTDWKDFGIDVACLQPNYAFSANVPKSRLDDAAAIAKKYGMCIEIEMDYLAGGLNTASTQRYFDYLESGAELGYMTDAIHFYYIGLKNFDGDAYYSDTGRRLMYDYTYRFIKGTLKAKPDSVGDIEVNAVNNEPVEIELLPYTYDKLFALGVSPSHGSVTVTNDGKAVYYPAPGFTGKDVFSFRYSERLGWSDECRVVVNVG